MERAVVFYSLSRNTKETAEYMANRLGAELYEVTTVKPLPKAKALQFVVGGRQATFGIKPEINKLDLDINKFDEIILGTPIWASKQAPAISTLLENKELCDKVVGVFTYSAGGDNEKCIQGLRTMLPNLKHQISLADKTSKFAKENESKMERFLGEFLNGER